MRQSYKVFINNFFILFADSDNNKNQICKNYKFINSYKELISYLVLKNYIITCNLVLYSNNVKSLIKRFKSHFVVLYAAGGIVVNKQNQLLMIKKNNIWDLPKGKVDLFESYKNAAIREVHEETNAKCIILNKNSYCTSHIYRDSFNSNQLVLKITYWFCMSLISTEMLNPQKSEGITSVEWVSLDNEVKKNTYASIVDLLKNQIELI